MTTHHLHHPLILQIVLGRTAKGKPYLVSPNPKALEYPNFNFNVSHHGKYVVIASEPLRLVQLAHPTPLPTTGSDGE